MSLRRSQPDDEQDGRGRRWRFALIAGATGGVVIALVVQPAWAVPVTAGVAVATLLSDVLRRKRRKDE